MGRKQRNVESNGSELRGRESRLRSGRRTDLALQRRIEAEVEIWKEQAIVSWELSRELAKFELGRIYDTCDA